MSSAIAGIIVNKNRADVRVRARMRIISLDIASNGSRAYHKKRHALRKRKKNEPFYIF